MKSKSVDIQGVVRWLLPKEDSFYLMLEELAVIAHEAALSLAVFEQPDSSTGAIRDKVQELEHRADGVVHQMEDMLARTFVTPIDREDLHKLAFDLDDVVDLTNLAARTCALYNVERPTEAMNGLIDVLVSCAEILRSAVPRLRTHDYALLIESGRLMRSLEKKADIIFRSAMSELFRDPAVDAKLLLKQKEVLDALERAVDRCDLLAGTLTNIAVKHG